jgi:NAD-dependent histone deacetylase SIR2
MNYILFIRSTLLSISRQYLSDKSFRHDKFFNIGRKHKAHRRQAQQEKPWRNSEKGRKGKGKVSRGKMGQEESTVVDPNASPRTLKARTLEALAQYIKDGRAQKIVVMVGSVTL